MYNQSHGHNNTGLKKADQSTKFMSFISSVSHYLFTRLGEKSFNTWWLYMLNRIYCIKYTQTISSEYIKV